MLMSSFSDVFRFFFNLDDGSFMPLGLANEAVIQCLATDVGFETLLTVMFFMLGFFMLQVSHPRALDQQAVFAVLEKIDAM